MNRTIPVLTLHQPWATFVAIGAKTIETRSWATPYRGLIGIHAGALNRDRLDDVLAEPYRSLLVRHGLKAVGDLPWGAVIALATLSDCVRMTPAFIADLRARDPQEHELGFYEPGRYAWVLRDVTPMATPFPARGRQGLWRVEVPS